MRAGSGRTSGGWWCGWPGPEGGSGQRTAGLEGTGILEGPAYRRIQSSLSESRLVLFYFCLGYY